MSYYEIAMDADIALSQKNIKTQLEHLDLTSGIIFITDILGGTPSNIAQEIASKHNASLLTGVNLPMIIRLLNYRNKDKQTLIKKALDGATKSIQHINPTFD